MSVTNLGGMKMTSIINKLRVIFAILTITPVIQSWASDPDPKPSETSQTSTESSSSTSSAEDNPMSHVVN